MKYRKRSIAAWAVAVLLGATSAWTIEQEKSDEILSLDVERKIVNYVHYSIYDLVWIAVKDGVVTLYGYVTQPYKANEMAKMVQRIGGVKKVENEIETLPVSMQDQQIRETIASRIYADDLFSRYSVQANPPIHIVVKNGRVMLAGEVDSEVQKRKAEDIARGMLGVFGVDNRLQVQ